MAEQKDPEITSPMDTLNNYIYIDNSEKNLEAGRTDLSVNGRMEATWIKVGGIDTAVNQTPGGTKHK